MEVFLAAKKCEGGDYYVTPGKKDIYIQAGISVTLGVSAFLSFCFLRPRWKSLYAARKRRLDATIGLPVLPDSFLGWVPALYKVTEEQVLASAGLDAFVFLSFFKMTIRLFLVMVFFAAVVLWPINKTFVGDFDDGRSGDDEASIVFPTFGAYDDIASAFFDNQEEQSLAYLWAWLVFTWFFSFLTIWYLNSETNKIIRLRQEYLGTQSTITDRTFRMSGIPKELRIEEKIKSFVEDLEIGHVKSVTLCKDWREIDNLMAERLALLRKLEEAWSVYLSQKPPAPILAVADTTANGDDSDAGEDGNENGRLLADDNLRSLVTERPRPTVRIRYGFLKLQSRKTDAMDYYEEKLRRLDDKIRNVRKKDFTPADTAFITMDSIAACQMAIQALIDPRPGQLTSKPAPSPSDVVWRNTYTPRWKRTVQSWTITIFITLLSLVWLSLVSFLAVFLSLCFIRQAAPRLAEILTRHDIIRALVQTNLPVLGVSILNAAVPFLYDYLANNQGMISQGDVELSVISKNFFFTFFNIFLVFAVAGTTSRFWSIVRDSFGDTRALAKELAANVWNLSNFYSNFIMLQGLGLFPFRLLQVGSISLYPVYRMGSKTPRDFAELIQPTTFNYGFYLPTALLVFILGLVYSVFPGGFLILFLSLCYFVLGYFSYKYQLLYAMDQPQHATGGAWRLISYRIILGLFVFQIVMSAEFALRQGVIQSFLVAPLVLLTFWYSYYWRHRFAPLTKSIALRSIVRPGDSSADLGSVSDEEGGPTRPQQRLFRRLSTIDEDREKGMRFVNPTLVLPLEQPWVYRDPPPILPDDEENEGTESRSNRTTPDGEEYNGSNDGRLPNAPSDSSSLSLGDTHIWRDSEN